jgi:hypothetical protein
VRATDRRIDGLWRRIDAGSWVSPQLCAVAELVDPQFESRCDQYFEWVSARMRAEGWEQEQSPFDAAKSVAALLALRGLEFPPALASLRNRDHDDGGTIAAGWHKKLVHALLDGGLSTS